MATESFTLNQEMKRRRAMVLSLVGGVIVSTLAFSNDRALFSQATASAGTPPVAYAFAPPAEGVGIGGLAGGPGAARNFVTPRRTGTTGTPAGLGQPDAPVAFAVQTPGDAPADGTTATPAASSFAAPGAAPAATGGGQQFAGNPDFGGSNGGVGGSSAAAPTDPTTPPGTTDPTTPPGTTDPTTPPGTTDPTTPPVVTDPTTPTDPGTPGPVSPVPEPATWLMMIVGFGFVGAMLRRGRRPVRVEAARIETVSAATSAS